MPRRSASAGVPTSDQGIGGCLLAMSRDKWSPGERYSAASSSTRSTWRVGATPSPRSGASDLPARGSRIKPAQEATVAASAEQWIWNKQRWGTRQQHLNSVTAASFARAGPGTGGHRAVLDARALLAGHPVVETRGALDVGQATAGGPRSVTPGLVPAVVDLRQATRLHGAAGLRPSRGGAQGVAVCILRRPDASRLFGRCDVFAPGGCPLVAEGTSLRRWRRRSPPATALIVAVCGSDPRSRTHQRANRATCRAPGARRAQARIIIAAMPASTFRTVGTLSRQLAGRSSGISKSNLRQQVANVRLEALRRVE